MAVAIAIEAIAIKPEIGFRGFNGIGTHGLCVSAAVLHQTSYEDPDVASSPGVIIAFFGLNCDCLKRNHNCDVLKVPENRI